MGITSTEIHAGQEMLVSWLPKVRSGRLDYALALSAAKKGIHSGVMESFLIAGNSSGSPISSKLLYDVYDHKALTPVVLKNYFNRLQSLRA